MSIAGIVRADYGEFMRVFILFALLALPGCDTVQSLWPLDRAKPDPVPVSAPPANVAVEPPVVPVAPVATPGIGGAQTIAALGDPAQPGLWLKTPLVDREGPGRVSYAGRTVDVTLIPIEGPETAGSRMSLAAMRALGAPLTELVEVSVVSDT
jgi:hypothetical protein